PGDEISTRIGASDCCASAMRRSQVVRATLWLMSPNTKTKRDLNVSWSVMLSGRSGRSERSTFSGLSSPGSSWLCSLSDMTFSSRGRHCVAARGRRQRARWAPRPQARNAPPVRSEQHEYVTYRDGEQHQRRGREHQEAHRHEVPRALDERMHDAQADVGPRQ